MKVLITVDDTHTSQSVLTVFRNLVRPPEEVILLHVQQLEGKSLMIGMLGSSEMSTLRESLKGTEMKERLDRKAEALLSRCRNELTDSGLVKVKTVVREGIPAEEILHVAAEEGVGLIIMGCHGKKGLQRLVAGCVTKDVERNSTVPVLVAKTDGCEKAYGMKEARTAYAQ